MKVRSQQRPRPLACALIIIYVSLLSGLAGIWTSEHHKSRHIEQLLHEVSGNASQRQHTLLLLAENNKYLDISLLKLMLPPVQDYKATEKKIDQISKNAHMLLEQYNNLATDAVEKIYLERLTKTNDLHGQHTTALLKIIQTGNTSLTNTFFRDNWLQSLNAVQSSTTQLNDYVLQREITRQQTTRHILSSQTKNRIWLYGGIAVAAIILGIVVIGVIKKIRITRAILAETDNQYHTILEQSGEIISIADQDGKYTFVNNTFKNKLEYNDEDMSSLTIDDILSDESKKLCSLGPLKKEHGDIYKGMRKTLVSKSGKKIIVEGNIILNYQDDIFKGSTVFLNDITEKIDAEKQLLAAEDRYRNLFNLSPLPNWIIEADTGAFLQVNKAAVDLYGYQPDEFLRMTMADITVSEHNSIGEILSNITGRKDTPFKGVYRQFKNNGDTIDVEIYSSAPFLNKTWQRAVAACDITEKNLFEQRLTRAIIKTQEDERYEIGGELHDNICQILAATQLTLGMLKPTLSPLSNNFYEQTSNNIQLASLEIRNLSHRLAPAFFDETSLEDALLRLLKSSNPNDKFNIVVQFDATEKLHIIPLDIKVNLYRILQEQLRNILKYARASTIEVKVKTQEHYLYMEVADDGIGFDTNKASYGIGFANMQRRTKMFMGSFIVNSLPGKGCKIIAKIPFQTIGR